MRERFEQQMEILHTELIELGALCEQAIGQTYEVLLEGNQRAAEEIIKKDQIVDAKEREIEDLCFRIILQQQRLCIARALAVQPEVLLMDEPTSALDPISTSKIEDLAVELKKDYTIVMVTHNMQQAARISDKTAFFLLGDVVEFGETEKIFSMPQDKRTEEYITGRFG